ncbi:MAG: hypothetical protein LBK42_01960 [Propionibacteriaceae bacterium]|jgi:hypothetical protein|nr:hypothetical protein [Propionibacteriaceae bacterium]
MTQELLTMGLPRPTNPAERYAVLKALIAALSEARAEAESDVLAVAAEVGVKSFSTPAGNVTVVTTSDTVEVDEQALAATLPAEQTMVVPKDWALAAAKKRLRIVQGLPVDADTGEVVDWATVLPGGKRSLRWPATDEQRAAKTAAWEALAARMPGLFGPVQVEG